MKTYVTVGDFIDSYYRLKNKGLGFFFSRLNLSPKQRTKKAWNNNIINNPRWWEIPTVKDRLNFLKTGNRKIEVAEYIYNKFIKDKQNLTMLSPGCGTGFKELNFAKFKEIAKLDAFDIAEKRITAAKNTAQKLGFTNVNFFSADISTYDFGNEKYDIIIFDSFLHHVKNVAGTLKKAKQALTKNGILIIDEYVGRNRFQWEQEQLEAANIALMRLPVNLRRRMSGKVKYKIYRPGLIRMILSDPSEAVNSEAIIEQLNKLFIPIEVHLIGGNILQLVLKDIEHNFVDSTEETNTALSQLFEKEDSFIAEGKSDFLFGIYKK